MPKQPLCDRCKLPHPPLLDCVEAMAANLRTLLLRVGTIDKCVKCGATIYWLRHLSGKSAPYNEAGLIHFADCPFAEEFSGSTRREQTYGTPRPGETAEKSEYR
jgi:hypothetical protein